MTEHGGYGMKLDGVTIAKPKPRACTIAVLQGRFAAHRQLDCTRQRAKPRCSGFDRHPSACGKTTSCTRPTGGRRSQEMGLDRRWRDGDSPLRDRPQRGAQRAVRRDHQSHHGARARGRLASRGRDRHRAARRQLVVPEVRHLRADRSHARLASRARSRQASSSRTTSTCAKKRSAIFSTFPRRQVKRRHPARASSFLATTRQTRFDSRLSTPTCQTDHATSVSCSSTMAVRTRR